MIFYGRKSTVIEGARVPVVCPNCQELQLTSGRIFPYAHIYWIPLLPLPSSLVSVCGHCKQALADKEIPDSLIPAVSSSVQEVRRPLTHYAGLFLIALLVAWGGYRSGETKKSHAALVAEPTAGDLYVFNMEKTPEMESMVIVDGKQTFRYARARVEDVGSGQVVLQMGNMAYHSSSKALDDEAGEYSDARIALKPERLKELLDLEAVTSIIRQAE